MTKAESKIWNSPHWTCERRVLAHRHDGTHYYINVYKARIDGDYYELQCDSYYGDSILTKNGENPQNIEINYDTALEGLI